MSEERQYFCLCLNNCRFETMTKEQIITAIAEATGATPTSIDDAFITKIKEQNGNIPLKFWIGTQAEYNAITTPDQNTFYIFTDSSELDDIEQLAKDTAETKATEIVTPLQEDVEELQEQVDDIQDFIDTIPEKGKMLYSDTTTGIPAFQDVSVSVPNLSDYKVLRITTFGAGNVLCVKSGDTISGISVGVSDNQGTLRINSVSLVCDGNTITYNRSQTTSINGTTISAAPVGRAIAYIEGIY